MNNYENVSDRSPKPIKAEFFKTAIERMEKLLDLKTCQSIRDSCACSKGGWRLKAMKKISKDYQGKSLEDMIEAINQVAHMGNPILNPDDTISAQIGEEGGFECPCPVFNGSGFDLPVSITYCYCCAGHFRHHYQIALDVKLRTKFVESSALESQRTQPCRFIYEIID